MKIILNRAPVYKLRLLQALRLDSAKTLWKSLWSAPLFALLGYKLRLRQALPLASAKASWERLGLIPAFVFLFSCILVIPVSEHFYELHLTSKYYENALNEDVSTTSSASENGPDNKNNNVWPPETLRVALAEASHTKSGYETDAESPAPEVPRLSGTIITQNQRCAILEYSDRSTTSVEEGGQFGQTIARDIYDGHATLTSRHGSVTLEVRASGIPRDTAEKLDLPGSGELASVAANMRMVIQRINWTVPKSRALRKHVRRTLDRPVDLLIRGL